ncbi:NO-inducible flavohemoprotein [Flavobacterium seoulense]|uniref:Flavohemoprotein n=1 Tax=Flavobacterium seoulense TaxID=1492738 RepID=A0A066WXE1_9FLAO|nr:NO-inducible flavohemoprotein [Flavobacterium seoulense]KDN55614.1 nitric oxide dioxygenase [Flavobacterium seoulense]
MTDNQKKLIKATIPILQSSGEILTDYFYKRMFQHHPELKSVFNMGNQANGKQKHALAGAVLAYAEHIDNPSVLINVLKGIGNKHVSLNIQAQDYDIVGRHLIASIQEVLGDVATAELVEAWTAAYNELAEIMINIEAEFYLKNTEKTGAWNGWRNFTIKEIVTESEEIKSFYLYPTDGKEIANYTAGQYLSIQVFVEQLGLLQPRQYSLSSAFHPNYYRISVKKETALATQPDGLVSNTLHQMKEGDTVNVSAPAGNFSLQDNDAPIVLISGGVGVTPLLSMLETNQKTNKNKTIWIHGFRNASVHAFKEVVATIEEESDWLESYVFNEDLEENSSNGIIKGRVDLEKCKEAILLENAHYYLCGPAPFIKAHYESLVGFNIDKSNIFYEEFGPQSVSLN